MRFFSLYSRTDGIVDWRACLDDAAKALEIDSTHCGMAVTPGTYRFLDELLNQPKPRVARSGRGATRRLLKAA